MDLVEELRNHVLAEYLQDDEAEGFGNDDDLIELLNSMQVLRIVTHLETHYKIQVADDELVAENLGSVNKLAAYVESKRG